MAPGRYSVFVRVMRIALPLGAVALMALIVFWPRLHGLDALNGSGGIEAVDLERDGRVRLEKPRYVGEAEGGEAFAVEADAARVDPVSPRRIELEQMRAELPAPGRRDVELHADRAIYDRDAETIDLAGHVELETSDGYRLRTEAATMALEAGRVETQAPVAGEGPKGAIAADRMQVEERGDILRFKGNVRVTLTSPGGEEGGS